jgi:pimeloyl-ACP methyl ester carboxylesterase
MTTWLDVDGVRLEAVWVGPPCRSGSALVFLHEGLGSITQWRDTPSAIADATGLPALVYARQGYGRSSPTSVPRPLAYMHDEAARLPRVLAAAGIDTPALIGHSDGASIAIVAAGTHAVQPRALVLIAPHVFVEDLSLASIHRAAVEYRTGDLRDRLARHHADVDGAFWGWNRAWLDPDFRRWNLEAFLASIMAPTLIVQGSADEYGTLAQVDAIARQLGGPHETVIVEGAGHAPHRSHPTEVHAAIASFIARTSGTSG